MYVTCFAKHTWIVPALLVGWIAFIYGTSSTVVRPQEFFEAIHESVLTSEQAFQRFEIFWGVSWFVIVKGWHFTEFAILLLLFAPAIGQIASRYDARIVAWAMLGCLAFAVSDEWHQTFVPDRLGTVTDVAIDGLGILAAGLLVMHRWRRCESSR